MFNRLFNRSNNNLNNDNGSHDGSTPENSSQGEEPNEEMPEPEESPIPSSPLVRTADCKTVVRLYLEVLSCDDLGPDFDENGERVTKTYTPYVKVKLGGNDDKDSLDIHKTKSVQQRYVRFFSGRLRCTADHAFMVYDMLLYNARIYLVSDCVMVLFPFKSYIFFDSGFSF